VRTWLGLPLAVVVVLAPSISRAIFIYDNGEDPSSAKVIVKTTAQTDELEVVITGPQADWYKDEKGWRCRNTATLDERRIQPQLNGIDWARAKLDRKFFEQKRREAIQTARQKLPPVWECRFSFVPAVPVTGELRQLIRESVATDAYFLNRWCDSQLGYNNVAWGFQELSDEILPALAQQKDRDERGFWVRDRKGRTVFRCQNDMMPPCWVRPPIEINKTPPRSKGVTPPGPVSDPHGA
jgi:hypothetical protein